MSRIIKVKNTGADDTWVGMLITQDSYYQLEDIELQKWRSDLKVFQDISSGVLVVNDGTNDFSDALEGYDYLKQDIVLTKPETTSSGELHLPEVIIHKPDMSSSTKTTHDFCDKTTWYTESTQVTGKSLSLVSGTVYTTGDTFLIDTCHGKIFDEDSLTTSGAHYKVTIAQGGSDDRIYKVKVYDNGVELTEDQDYTVDYAAGTVDFGSYSIQGALTMDYYKAGGADFVLKPSTGKIMIIEHSELQLSKNCVMNKPISFEVWVYHPDQVNNPGVKIPYQINTYKNIKDLINGCNKGKGKIEAMSNLGNDVVVFPFEYATIKPFKASIGAELRITMDGTDPITGEWGTATFYIVSKDE